MARESAEPAEQQTPELTQVIDAIDQIGQTRFSGMSASRAEMGVLDRWASCPPRCRRR